MGGDNSLHIDTLAGFLVQERGMTFVRLHTAQKISILVVPLGHRKSQTSEPLRHEAHLEVVEVSGASAERGHSAECTGEFQTAEGEYPPLPLALAS